ncbi:FkbM family methyltransferase [Thioalkalivibrio sp.]|uniref:FkbM family methyltransferase n=1 Tax=Thioalkalivibrio sp. TaxID=2093813 RepID=UPI003976B67A
MNPIPWHRTLGVLRSLVIYWRPGRQRGLRRLYRPFLQEPALVFDVGAHLGDRTRAFASLGARVVALEPQPHLFRWLQRLVGSRAGVILRPEGVGRHAGEATLAVSPRTPTVSTLSRHWQTDLGRSNPSFGTVTWEESVRIPMVTLDQLIAEYGLPDFCKIDVEGFEAEVLAGLSQPVPALSLEFVAGALEIAKDAVRRLAALGPYEYNAIRGERRQYLFARWLPAEALLQWLEQGADALPSGDIYARLPGSRGSRAHLPGRPQPKAERQHVSTVPPSARGLQP